MHLTPENVRKIAHLARLKIEDSKITEVADTLSHILDWVEQLNAVETNDVEPMYSVNVDSAPVRPDQVNDGNKVKEILMNAPDKGLDMFVVPKVVE